MFHVGQKVVCVKIGSDYAAWCNLPTIDRAYIIRWIGTDDVRLEEVNNAACWCLRSDTGEIFFEEPSFYASWFRPLVERKTDIGVLTALLDPANHRELADG